jgi:type II secretion system protein N
MDSDSTAVMTRFSPSPGAAKTFAGWALLALTLLSLFIVVLFPYDLLQARILTLAAVSTGTDIRAATWEWAWPIGLRWHDVTVSGPTSFEAATVEIRPSGRALAQGKPGLQMALSLRVSEKPSVGLVNLQLQLDGWSIHKPAHATGLFDRLDVSAFDRTQVRQGTLRVTFDHRWDDAADTARLLHGDGIWDALLSDLSLDHLTLGPFRLAPAEISAVKAHLVCKEGTCEIQELHGEGPDGTATGTGTFSPRLPLRESALNLTVDLVPSASMAQKAGNPMIQAGVPVRLTVSGKLSGLTVSL